ncbi:MAG: type II toxin-antitoxin system RelB/DinJ family antitoxin [Bacillota bacterium]
MAKTAVLHARVDVELKENVEFILSQIGLSGSDAINLLYRQIEMQGGLPFELKVDQRALATRKLMQELKKGETAISESGLLTIEESKKMLGI